MIPRIIHQMWINPKTLGAESFPDDVARHARHWRLHHPEYLHRVWSLDDVIRLVDPVLGDRLVAALHALRLPASIADLSRMVLLYEFGGFWTDLKLDIHAPFLNELLRHDLVLTEHFPKPDFPEPNGFLINSFIGAMPRSPFIRRVMELILEKIEAKQGESTFFVTGPLNLQKAMSEFQRPQLGDYKMLRHEETWEKLFHNGGASYNADGMHWSIREQNESIYK